MAERRSFRQASKTDWHTSQEGTPTLEQINCGSLMRIADALEKVASSYDAMREDRDRHKLWHEQEAAANKRLRRSNAALRGHIKRMKGGR